MKTEMDFVLQDSNSYPIWVSFSSPTTLYLYDSTQVSFKDTSKYPATIYYLHDTPTPNSPCEGVMELTLTYSSNSCLGQTAGSGLVSIDTNTKRQFVLIGDWQNLASSPFSGTCVIEYQMIFRNYDAFTYQLSGTSNTYKFTLEYCDNTSF